MKIYLSVALLLGMAGWTLRSAPAGREPHTNVRQAAFSDSAVLAELKKALSPLSTVRTGQPYTDLEAFREGIGNARVVALGEPSHGSREVAQLKHRFFEYLVREKGFTVLAIEANWPESEPLDRYIKTGEGDPRAGLKALRFYMWQTEEVLSLVQWMRAFNQAPGDHPILTITGFESQTHGAALERVLTAVRGTPDAALVEAAYEPLRALKDEPWVDPGLRESADRADSVVSLLERAGATPETIRLARVVAQALRLRSGEGGGMRDRVIASNVQWLLGDGHPSEKVVIWAHNGHVTAEPEVNLPGPAIRRMGSWLREQLGSQLYVLGFAIDSGTVRARSIENGRVMPVATEHRLPPTPPGTGTAMLRQAGVPMFFLNLRTARGGLAAWLEDEHLFRELGGAWSGDQAPMIPRRLSRSFDGLIFVRHTTAARPL